MAGSDVVGTVHLTPDAGLVEALGVNHSLESAIADLIDNSIDAGATLIVIRLLSRTSRLMQLEILDDGRGMTHDELTSAMTIGLRREYSATDLGHFGLGLKSASFGHANTLTLWSRVGTGDSGGRRIRREEYSKDYTCELLSKRSSTKATQSRRRFTRAGSGTSVVLTDLRNTYRGRETDEAQAWLSDTESRIRTHLGVVFHRLLEQKDGEPAIRIEIHVDEIDGEDSIGIPVLPIDPFGYQNSGHADYPKELTLAAGGKDFTAACHIWPAKADVTGFRIGPRSGDSLQGFYVYRNDRLLQLGGWSDILTPSPSRQLARVLLDNSSMMNGLISINPEKLGVKFEPAFHDAITQAKFADGSSFDDYVDEAEVVYVEANRRFRARKPAVLPDRGFSPQVRKAIKSELDMLDGPTIKVQWKNFRRGEFIDIDAKEQVVWLNSKYRYLFTADGGGSMNDAPVLKTLVYLLTQRVFAGQKVGARTKDEIELWKSLLGAAVLEEERLQGPRD